ncbi:MAG: DUF5990 family protein [Bacteroidia bacterium]
MKFELPLRILLIKPTPKVDFGLQKGSGKNYETVQIQQTVSGDLSFTCMVLFSGDKSTDEYPKTGGPFVHGPAGGKFIYINIGVSAGQTHSLWNRRLKIPLTGITWEMTDALLADSGRSIVTHVAGTGKDGSPNCATVKPFSGWEISS